MTVTLSWQSIITLSSGLAAIVAIVVLFAKGVRWFDRQKKQDKEIADLHAQHDADVKAIREEQTLVMYGILACLKGLQEQGCNGPVTEAIGKIDKYLNKKAHGV